LTNGFRKKVENHEAAAALHFVPLQLPRASDAPRDARDAAGLTGRVWESADLIGLLDAADQKAA